MQAIDGRARHGACDPLAGNPVDMVDTAGLMNVGDPAGSVGAVAGAGLGSADLRGLADLVRAQRRVLDAEAEFDAVLDAGGSMLLLGACDRELTLAVAARDVVLSSADRRSAGVGCLSRALSNGSL